MNKFCEIQHKYIVSDEITDAGERVGEGEEEDQLERKLHAWSHRYSNPPWSRFEGKYLVNFQGMLPDSGSMLRGINFWEVPFALMLSPGWGEVERKSECPPLGGRVRKMCPQGESVSLPPIHRGGTF